MLTEALEEWRKAEGELARARHAVSMLASQMADKPVPISVSILPDGFARGMAMFVTSPEASAAREAERKATAAFRRAVVAAHASHQHSRAHGG